jgi:hypothetical protein
MALLPTNALHVMLAIFCTQISGVGPALSYQTLLRITSYAHPVVRIALLVKTPCTCVLNAQQVSTSIRMAHVDPVQFLACSSLAQTAKYAMEIV